MMAALAAWVLVWAWGCEVIGMVDRFGFLEFDRELLWKSMVVEVVMMV
jgi:hypothetical protein